jgi:hypothetical protein
MKKLSRVICGSGRSGTTWVLDCLAEANELRPIFEPLHSSESELGARYAYQVLLAGERVPDLELFFEELAAGRVRSNWVDYRIPRGLLLPKPTNFASWRFTKSWVREWRKHLEVRKKLSIAKKRNNTLIKCIRANLMAGWLQNTMGFRTVLLVRHPCSVIESKMRFLRVWDPTHIVDRYRANQKLHDLTDGRYIKRLNSSLTTTEALALNWIIENQWPAERSSSDGYAVFYYEDLLSKSEVTWQRLCNELHLKIVPNSSLLRKPSQQAALRHQDHRKEIDEPRWRKSLTTEQLKSIQALFDETNCHLYNVDRTKPIASQ